MNGVLYTESGSRSLIRDIGSARENTVRHVYMIKRHRNAETDRNKKQDLY